MADFTRVKDKKFLVVCEESDKEMLLKLGLRFVQQFNNCGKMNYVFINNPSIIQNYSLDNIQLSYTNRLMF